MLPFSTEFQTGESKITLIQLDVLLADGTPVHMTEEHVMLGGFTRDTSTTVDGEFTIGAAVTGKLTVYIDNSGNTFSGYDFRNAEITAYLGGQLPNEEIELVPVGIYTVDGYVYDGCNITLTAYDNLHKFNKKCSETDATNPTTFSQTISQLVNKACSIAGVTLANESVPNGAYVVTKKPEAWDTMTWHDVIAYCAQIACCFATILPDGRLFFSWYNTAFFRGGQLDGGTFGTQTTPYYDGDVADGGDFTYGSTIDYDGGRFGDRNDAHYLGSLFSLSVDTDDAIITGVRVLLTPSNNINATEDTKDYEAIRGTNDYCVKIENNPFIETVANADFVASYVYDAIADMRFRPLSATVFENPAIEAGDIAVVTDHRNNAYLSFISHATYTTGASTSISCDAESPMRNLKDRYSEADKTRSLIERSFQKSIISTDAVIDQIMSGYATTMGLNRFSDTDSEGRSIWTYGNGNTLASSRIRWRFSAGAFSVSNNYGASWNAAITPEGLAVFKEIYAVKVNADNILTGTLTVGGRNNQSGVISLRDANNVICGTVDNTGVTALGSYISYRASDGYASKITAGRMFLYSTDSSYTYEQLKNLGWADSICSLNVGRNTGTGKKGFSITSRRDFVSLGKGLNEVQFEPYIVANFGGYDGYSEKCLLGGSTRVLGPIHVHKGSSIHLYNSSATSAGIIRWHLSSDSSKYAFMGYYEQGNLFDLRCDSAATPANLHVGNLNSYGSKRRVVKTKHYGDVGLNAFETPNPYFADIGSGTVGEDGTVTIFFDPVFEETIETNAEYQVFLTRTSEAQTEWVDKQNGFFIVHGEPGATFDWMVTCHQRDYVASRLETVEEPEPYVSDDPIIEEDTSAIDAVNEMIDQYNEQLEGIA